MQKGKIADYDSFRNEIQILMQLVSPPLVTVMRLCLGPPQHHQAPRDVGDRPYLFLSYRVSPNFAIGPLTTNLMGRLCEGGELFYFITKRKHLTESQAASVMRQAFYALCYLHNNKICHRDIKPENFLLFKENDDSYIKLIDFGLAKRVSRNEVMNSPNGTPYYIAPEVLKGSYTTQCDNWSMGVVMYIMLSGKPPFGGRSNKEIIDNVLKGTYNFNGSVWQAISDKAKSLISQLIER